MVYLPVMDGFLCCVFCVLYCSVTLYYSVLLFFFCVLYCLLFLYCTVSACDVRAATLTEGFPCFFLICKANATV
jgi:Flp pilus assembly protein TadB